jgi:hypothetical protein
LGAVVDVRNVLHLRSQPVGDRCRSVGICQRPDLVEPVLVVHGDALMLTEMLLPGGDDELFDDARAISTLISTGPTGDVSAVSWDCAAGTGPPVPPIELSAEMPPP